MAIKFDTKLTVDCARPPACDLPTTENPGGNGGGTDPRCEDVAFATANPDICGPGGIDPNCADPVYAAAHPEICDGSAAVQLILKPSVVDLCAGGSTKVMAVFVYANGVEEEVTQGLLFSSSNTDVAWVGLGTGKVSAVGEGTATISVTWQDLTAYSEVTVGGGECCDDTKVGMMLVVDNSHSMSLAFDTPGGGSSFGTKLGYAKFLAKRIADELNTTKDVLGLITFHEAGTLVETLTNNKEEVRNEVSAIFGTENSTNIFDGLNDAIAVLNADTTLKRRVVMLFSDGENKMGDSPVSIADAFKESGGIIIAVGIRAHGTGFALMANLASDGYFLNGHSDTRLATPELLSGLKGYFCAGNCTPPGDVIVPQARLNYTGFINWDVNGVVDLIGGDPPYELFDLLPGNGMYVDLVGSTPPWLGAIRTKNTFAVVAGTQYRIRYSLAGNQRADVSAGWSVHILVRDEANNINHLNETRVITNPAQGFVEYTNTFTPVASGNVYIQIAQMTRPADPPSHPSFGIPLDVVKLERVSDGVTLFFDDFDEENPTYIPPQCGQSAGGYGGYEYVSGYNCYGYGCATEPVPKQVQDPNPPPDLET